MTLEFKPVEGPVRSRTAADFPIGTRVEIDPHMILAQRGALKAQYALHMAIANHPTVTARELVRHLTAANAILGQIRDIENEY